MFIINNIAYFIWTKYHLTINFKNKTDEYQEHVLTLEHYVQSNWISNVLIASFSSKVRFSFWKIIQRPYNWRESQKESYTLVVRYKLFNNDITILSSQKVKTKITYKQKIHEPFSWVFSSFFVSFIHISCKYEPKIPTTKLYKKTII